MRLGFNNVSKEWAYICEGDNIIYYRKGLGVWRGKIIDFYNYNGLNVKCRFYNNLELTFPVSKLRRLETFWWVAIDI